eukprot:CAMPEP_0185576106 /NCGR_PEP_ID=MMETSP0434-20130131/7111_1 /TAXON_ID=626734 ORGANISM="Favella taraikaensis, Strain Fe Narragansett Bay" /NCGR_SAMPLE_ID=MMETSP0434 /ASSEMBLY_ACC=CAM_ASM_000379 /LENGTH=73 /DNA_ID=CAMNT_0028193187 /DNA_START=1678 /DNA_END=1899 /DNA_ORIENTATION=+
MLLLTPLKKKNERVTWGSWGEFAKEEPAAENSLPGKGIKSEICGIWELYFLKLVFVLWRTPSLKVIGEESPSM